MLFLLITRVFFLQSMVGVPHGGLGSRPVLSELAGVYGVLLHGAPDADALAQLPVEPLRVGRGGGGSIESRDAVGGGVATGAGLVQGNNSLADGFTARAFTLRTQGLGDHADALEVREFFSILSRVALFVHE